MGFDSGSKPVQIAGGPISFYGTATTTNLYVEKPFGGTIKTLVVANDSDTDTVTVSFDGATVNADLLPRESLELNVSGISGIYIKGTAGGDTVRYWGW